MSIRARAVRVHQVPEKVTSTRERSFLREVQTYAQSQRPRLVLDCSKVQDLDNVALHMLLSCLEEVMRCNGDVRLASLRPKAEAALRVAGVLRLFEVYATPEAAVNSFHHRTNSMALHLSGDEGVSRDAEHAA